MQTSLKSALVFLFTLTASFAAHAQQELSATTPAQNRALTWQSGERSRGGLYYVRNHGHLLQLFRFHNPINQVEMLQIPVQVQNETCQGINTLGFAFMAENSFATGEYQNLKGHHIRDLFDSYRGRAVGGGVLAGYGKWASVSNSGLQLKKSLTALPVPIMGGDIALGYTDCQISFSVSDQGQATYSGLDHKQEVIELKDIADWEL
jgi:hypothetical protein